MTSPSPADRTIRFSLRLTPDEMAAVEDVQEHAGGEREMSLNSAIALLIAEGYHYRRAAQAWECLPVDGASYAYVREAAGELGLPTAAALQLLIKRGVPHQPQQGCRSYTSKVRPPERDQLPTPPEPPRYASPRPADLPPVRPVPGQTAITESEGTHQ